MNKLIIALVAAVLVGGGLWLALSGTRDSQDTTSQSQSAGNSDAGQAESSNHGQADHEHEEEARGQEVQVTYTENGFEPSSVTIKAGDTVTWTNQSGSPMWVASDNHPVHNDLPGFDQLGEGDTYSFTFTEAGTWGYHNHVNHQIMGTVIVN